MSVREFTPLFSWGFGFRQSKYLVPLLNADVFTLPPSAVCGTAGLHSPWVDGSEVDHDSPDAGSIDVGLGCGGPASGKAAVESAQSAPRSDGMIEMKVAGGGTVLVRDPKAAVPKAPTGKAESNSDTTTTNTASTSAVAAAPAGTATATSTATSSEQTNPNAPPQDAPPRPIEEISQLPTDELNDAEVLALVQASLLPAYKLEASLDDAARGVRIRRMLMEATIGEGYNIGPLPNEHFDYNDVYGACCENVVGYVPIPVGVAGPLILDGEEFHVPMATTEGCLVASTARGFKAMAASGGASAEVLDSGMTRAPLIRMPNIAQAAGLRRWVDEPENLATVAAAFESTSRFAKLLSVKVACAGRHVFLRFKASTGDAMGMNMVGKATEAALGAITEAFPDAEVMALSGNFCTDKKPAAVNWVEGRGKSVVAEAIISEAVVKKVLKTTVDALVDINTHKNLVGSAMAGSVGGFNAHASNIVTAVFIATGQDPAQNVESSNCMTLMEKTEGGDLYVSVTMPSIEVGTVGGGTHLPGQSACLSMLGVKGPNYSEPGRNACTLARVVAASVMAGELSLLAALAAGHLIRAHMVHNRSSNKLAGSLQKLDEGAAAKEALKDTRTNKSAVF